MPLTERYYIHNQNPVMQWDELEVDELYRRPDHPVLLQANGVCILEPLLRILALHDRHAAQKDKEIGTSEYGLICEDAGDDLEVGLARKDDLTLEKAVPERSTGTEDAATVEGHAGCAGQTMAGDAATFDALLGHGVASCEENGCGDGLGE